MRVWRNLNITDIEHRMLKNIYNLRGATNNHLRQIECGHLTSEKDGQLSNISRATVSLRKMKLIKTVSCYPVSKEFLHYLTDKGVQYIHDHLTIDSSNPKAGFDNIHGSFTPSLLKPTLGHLEHHMMYVDFAIAYEQSDNMFIRHSLYCVKEFKYVHNISQERAVHKKGKLKPDGELQINKILAAVEIDTGSSRKHVLVDKFKRYRTFFDYCRKNNRSIPYAAIFFVTKRQDKIPLEKDERWQTIVQAAVEGLSNYCWEIQIIGVNKEKVIDILKEGKLDIPLPPKEDQSLNKIRQKNKQETIQSKETTGHSIKYNEYGELELFDN
ncbi:replication-relaxation family protein [Oceanobacillus salinisoli]|uniref:replication-relaxation family protein n=1 Tax=Oceanobacillus salinisoli TaxID=2678611 RepID=UPI0012E109D2|nr:replication-relaxation family protein [Oceanobacillus salinisoli]